jgi:hypothetical protein
MELGLMKASTSRVVYCIGLLAVTACAVLPETINKPVAATASAAPLSAEARLAHTIRDRIVLETELGPSDPKVQEAAAMESALRELAFADDAAATRRQLIGALADELSNAMAEKTKLEVRYNAAHHEMQKAAVLVAGLTAAINAEVHSNRG